MDKELNWNQTEFNTFLLIYAAHADLEFSDKEKQYILSKVSIPTFEKMLEIYNSMSEFAILQAIMDYKGLYYPTLDRKEELLDKMRKLFGSDGEYSSLEKNLMMFLERLL